MVGLAREIELSPINVGAEKLRFCTRASAREAPFIRTNRRSEFASAMRQLQVLEQCSGHL